MALRQDMLEARFGLSDLPFQFYPPSDGSTGEDRPKPAKRRPKKSKARHVKMPARPYLESWLGIMQADTLSDQRETEKIQWSCVSSLNILQDARKTSGMETDMTPEDMAEVPLDAYVQRMNRITAILL
jgi:hypothetical protein